MKNVVVFSEDMVDEVLRGEVISIAQNAFQLTITKGKVYSTIAATIRSNLEKEFGSVGWCCVVGKKFGACVTQEMKTYM